MKISAYGTKHSFTGLKPMYIERRDLAPTDIDIEIDYCGVCHSDVHQAKNEWKNTLYPCVPGHEIVGRVRAVGPAVSRFTVGDRVGVGCMVDSCRHCAACNQGLEQYCESGAIGTYNGNIRTPSEESLTFGGYSESIVVREDFVLRIPGALSFAAAAPLLCAGITTWSPLRHWKVGPGTRVGVVGLGGLGHLAVKLARALGAEVTVITGHELKRDAAHALGAAGVVNLTFEESMKANEGTLDFIISTVPQPHDANPYLTLLARDGVCVIVGCLVPLKTPLDMGKLVMDRKSVAASCIGGIAETQELLDFCASHGIQSDIEIVTIDAINDVYKRLDEGAVPHRYVIDMASLKRRPANEA